jgi:para-nitrobenzyl esterase
MDQGEYRGLRRGSRTGHGFREFGRRIVRALSHGCTLGEGAVRAGDLAERRRVFSPLQYRNRIAFGYKSAEAEGARIAPDIASLRKLPSGEVLARARSLITVDPTSVEFWPTVDGHVMPAHPAELFEQGRVANVPLIIGNTTDEGTLFAFIHPVKTAAAWREFARRAYPGDADDLLARYPAARDAEVFTTVSRYITDWIFAGTTRGVARAMARQNRRVWRYEFTRVNPGAWPNPRLPLGAFHSSELSYVFGELQWPGSAAESLRRHRPRARQSDECRLGAIRQSRRPERRRASIMASAKAKR